MNVTQQLIQTHLCEGKMEVGEEIALKIDQTLCQDATGTLVMLELEAMALDRAKTELSVQYVDHNLIQEDYKNPDDHLFLQSAAERFGLWFSRAGNGVSHPIHMMAFGKPGKTMVGSDSHTCAAGALGMLAIGVGGLEVAMAIAGEPLFVKMPAVIGIKLIGKLPDWVSAKDVVLEMLRRRGVNGCVDCVIEYYGPGLKNLDVWDRHVIANMGAEMGATTTVFPSDDITQQFFQSEQRANHWLSLSANHARYDQEDTIDLSQLEPLIALPSSPGNVVPVRDVIGQDLYQAYIGSSANPGFRDFAISALMVKSKQIHPSISFDINPTARSILEELANEGLLSDLIHAGARIHQAGCNGCIGMGQAPATDKNSLRTVPRNFPGRSGNKEDRVFLCSPETATASALKGVITDPRDLDFSYPKVQLPKQKVINHEMLQPPLPIDEAREIKLAKGPNIASLPQLDPMPNELNLVVLLKTGDHVSTDEIMPAGARVLPYRSNIPKLAEFVFDRIDESYPPRAQDLRQRNEKHAIVGGDNYGQGSSREHAALAPRYLGLALVICKGFARIHWENLINFGILPLTFMNSDDYKNLDQGDHIAIQEVWSQLKPGQTIMAQIVEKKLPINLKHRLSPRQIDIVKAGGLINWIKKTNR